MCRCRRRFSVAGGGFGSCAFGWSFRASFAAGTTSNVASHITLDVTANDRFSGLWIIWLQRSLRRSLLLALVGRLSRLPSSASLHTLHHALVTHSTRLRQSSAPWKLQVNEFGTRAETVIWITRSCGLRFPASPAGCYDLLLVLCSASCQ